MSSTSRTTFTTLLVGLASFFAVCSVFAQVDSTRGYGAAHGPPLDQDSMQAVVNSYESHTVRTSLEPPKTWETRGFTRPKSLSEDESIGNRGTEFWLLMQRNYNNDFSNAGEGQFLDLTSTQSTTGTIEIPGLDYSETFTTTPGEVTRVRLPNDVEVESSEEVEAKGIHITSESQITVYGLSRANVVTDGYLGLPRSVLSTNYVVPSYPSRPLLTPSYVSDESALSQFAIVSPRDGISVTITPSATTLTGRSAGQAFTIDLDKGEVYQVRSEVENGPDLTGSVIQASSPVAVFSGHSCMNVPPDVPYCDILIEQIPPTDTWGSSFVTRPLEGRENGDTFRILSGQEGTTVEINGESVATLGFGDYHETILEQPSTIEASNPVLVMQYSNGDEWDPSIDANGDPFMMMVPPSEQFSGQYTFSTPDEDFSLNYVNLAVPSDATESILVDGSPVQSSLFETIENSEFSVAAKDVELGSHSAESTSDTQFGIYSYGFENDESYGFTGGLTLDFISEGSAPNITRTPETIELGEEEIAGGQSITISAEITDPAAPLVQSATVFYRHVEEDTYSSVSMTNTEGDIWEGKIPGESVSDPGMEYYISATDGQLTGTSPEVNPSSTPYSIAVLPNETPTIDHTPISTAPPGEDLTVEASVMDNTDQVSLVQLFYRDAGGNPAYTTLEMQEEGDVYAATIPGAEVTEQGLEYYIRATDNFGVSTTEPEEAPDEPIEVEGPFGNWPDLDDPSITLKIVQPDLLDIVKVQLVGEKVSIFKSAPVISGFAKFSVPEPINDKFTKIRLLNQENQVLGYLPFQYTQSNYEEPIGIDAIVYVHDESKLQPVPTDWPEWDYYTDDCSGSNGCPQAHPLSMLVPPEGEVENVDLNQQDPVVLVHGLGAYYPAWGGVGKVRELTEHLDEEDYDGWQFYYPENQNVTKSGPLLAKAIHRLQNNLGYGTDQSFDVVAHSMGGLVSRHYIQRMGIASSRSTYSQVLSFDSGEPGSNVDKFLMLGTPNHGSYQAWGCTGQGKICNNLGSIAFNRDVGAPAYYQLTPGSRFLSDLNRSPTADNPYSPTSTLVLAGTSNPPFESGIPLPLEIPNQDDGLVAVSSASLLDLSIPLAVIDFTHTSALDRDDEYDPRLNEDTDAIITSFLSGENPSDLGEITGFWSSESGGEVDPEPSYTDGLSVNTEEGILTINAEETSVQELGVTTSCNTDGFPEVETCVRIGSNKGMKKVPAQNRFFTHVSEEATGIGIPLSLGFGAAAGLPAKAPRIATVQKLTFSPSIGVGTGNVGWKPMGLMSLSTKYLHTTQAHLELNDVQRTIAEAGGYTPSVEMSGPPGNASTTSSKSTALKKAGTVESKFQVDTETDTLSFWLAQDSTGEFSNHNMRLEAPDGTLIDSSEAKSESGFGYTQNHDLGYAIYSVVDPASGRWAVRYDASVDASVAAPVMSTVNLRARAPDSTFSTEETIPVTISFSDQNSYQDTQISAQLRVEDLGNGDIRTLGSIDLDETGPTTYEGQFSPSYVGSYQVAVDFSAKVGGESVLRRTVETVTVAGDSTNTPPEPPPAPTGLSAQVEGTEGVSLSWSTGGSGEVQEYRIYRDTIPNPVRPSGTVPSGQTAYTDSAIQGGQTYYYRVAAVGAGGVESNFAGGTSIFTYPSSLSVNLQRTFGSPSSERGYRLVALPGAVNQPLETTIGGEAGTDWQAWWDDGSSQDYFREYDGSDTFSFQPGRGFWVLKKSDWSVSQSVETVPLDGQQQTSIPLHDGWNIIANPFGGHVSWDAVNAVHSDSLRALWRFNGSFVQADTFRSAQAGEAFYFLNDTGLDSLQIPYPSDPGARAKEANTEEDPLLAISARLKGSEGPASTVKIGFDKAADKGLDRRDQPAPPGQFSALSLRLKAPGESSLRRRLLMTERRPPKTGPDAGHTFRLQLQTETKGPVQIITSGLDATEGSEVKLLRPSTGRSYDVSSEETITLEEADSTGLRLAVGSTTYVKDQVERIVPDEVTLTSYPNPFRTQATIEYTLPEAKDVRITVYDVLGRRVSVLENGRKEAGRHQVTLHGDRLASGVYFGRLRVGEKTLTQKITVLR